jgi:hypothetical protein
VVAVHNPDSYMFDFRQIVALGRKRLGFLIGAGGPADLQVNRTTGQLDEGGDPLIPTVAPLTTAVLEALPPEFEPAIAAIRHRSAPPFIENILSMTRGLSQVLGSAEVEGLDGEGYSRLSERICDEIGRRVDVLLPESANAFTELIGWIGGTKRAHPVEVFTTNYDLLFEQAFERLRLPYFDGFVGAATPFFDSSTVSTNDLPARWARLWKLHGPLGWSVDSRNTAVRGSTGSKNHLIYPEHLKYDQIQKAPYASLFDRLHRFLMTPDTLLIVSGFSFADAHVAARIDEALAANPAASVFAFQYRCLSEETHAGSLGRRRASFSVFAPDGAIMNCVEAPWRPGQLPSREWDAIRSSYWGTHGPQSSRFLLGRFSALARFVALSRSEQFVSGPVPPTEEVADQ